MIMSNKVIVITGPTATGKTKLGIEICKLHNGEVISADSMQIYKSMDIGTAKVTVEEAQGIKHHMVDIINPNENYSVSKYVEDASKCCDELLSLGKTPVIVGGTGLYIESLISGRDFADSDSDSTNIRTELENEYDRVGGEAMLEKLRSFDPERASKLFPNDKRRIIRAIEIYQLTGITITEHDEQTKLIPPRYDASIFALNYNDRDKLYEKINLRVDIMMEQGLVKEVENLLNSGIPENATAMQAIGYKEIVLALNGIITMDQAVDLIKQESRRYAKRQLTWLRRNEKVNWINWNDAPEMDYAISIISDIFKK